MSDFFVLNSGNLRETLTNIILVANSAVVKSLQERIFDRAKEQERERKKAGKGE